MADRPNNLFSIDHESTFFADGRRNPMISKAPGFDGLLDGIARAKKKTCLKNQTLNLPINNRVGVRDEA
ncbi:hypothetical protein, partial [Acinetobacter baumannii]|uniref:hypothetical protein n=1 Tax=Acinetobacter baumannii TaxID=470 RepID=UPI001C083310